MDDFFKVFHLRDGCIGKTDITIGVMSEFEVTRTRLKDLRKELGMSQAELAEAANKTRYAPGLLQSRISDIERGLKDALPTASQLAALSDVLHTNPGYLLGLTDDSQPQGEQSDQVVVTIEDPDRRVKIQAIADALRAMPDGDIVLVSSLVRRIQIGQADNVLAVQSDYEELDRLWMSIYMHAGAYETQRLLDTGMNASRYFRRMVAGVIAKDNKASDDGS